MLFAPKIVQGRFIGNTSCGFVSGQVYDLRLFTKNGFLWAADAHSRAKCPYISIHALSLNWEIPVKSDVPIEICVSNNIWLG